MNKTYQKNKAKYYETQTVERNTFTGRMRDVHHMKGDRTEEEFRFWIDILHHGQSAAKPHIEEGSETISKESTSQANGDGSARPQLKLIVG